jgi:hypothetical protein
LTPKVFNKRHRNVPADAVYVGRPSWWGNPFELGKDGDRAQVIEKFRLFMADDSVRREMCIAHLQGKHLVCWCAPKPCHADVLLKIANNL